nr:hypothetical protein [Megavirus caiporensis]
MSYNDFMVIQNDYFENFSIYIDNKPIIESPPIIDKSLSVINFDIILDKTKSVFETMFSPKYFMPNSREFDLMDREIEVYDMV